MQHGLQNVGAIFGTGFTEQSIVRLSGEKTVKHHQIENDWASGADGEHVGAVCLLAFLHKVSGSWGWEHILISTSISGQCRVWTWV